LKICAIIQDEFISDGIKWLVIKKKTRWIAEVIFYNPAVLAGSVIYGVLGATAF
jgi:hypothetical protein